MNENQDRLTLLFSQLHIADNPQLIEALQEEIWTLWLTHPNPEIDALMILGCDEMEVGDYLLATRTFTEMITKAPSYSEGWNKRATVYYLRGCFKRSLSDIEATLNLEPRHFGALSGKASIFREIGDYRSALKILYQLKHLVPHQKGLDEQIMEINCQLKSGK